MGTVPESTDWTSNNELFNQSLIVLKYSTIERLGQMLNSRKILTTMEGKLRDWRGLADFVRLDPSERSKVEQAHNHAGEIIWFWCKRPSKPNVGALIDFLELIDRFDIIQDLGHILAEDCQAAQGLAIANLQQGDYSLALSLQEVDALARGKELANFDAMVLFSDEDEEDVDFSMHVVDRMEKAGLRVFVPQRDLCLGTYQHASTVEIIEARCDKVVPIFTPSFVKSRKNIFLTNAAQHFAIKLNTNKIIPIIFKKCDIPSQFAMYHKLPYSPENRLFNFWDKLLVKTFYKNIPPELKAYTFPVPNSEVKRRPIVASYQPGSKEKAASGTNNGTMVVKLPETPKSKSETLMVRLPDTPNHDPNSDDSAVVDKSSEGKSKDKKSKKGGITKVLQIFKKKDKKDASLSPS